MFSLFKKPTGTKIELKISGMHCPSCSMNIDNTLEEIEGVLESSTNYAKGRSNLLVKNNFDPKKAKKEIEKLGYKLI